MGISRRDKERLLGRTGGEDSDIEKYGYSRKRLSNIMRFNTTAKAYLEGKEFAACLKALDQQVIHDVRRTELYTLDEALEISERLDEETYTLAKTFEANSDSSVLEELDDLLVELVSGRFV